MMAATEQIRNVNAVGCSAGNAGLCRIDESFGIFVVEGSKPIERFLYLFGKYHELTWVAATDMAQQERQIGRRREKTPKSSLLPFSCLFFSLYLDNFQLVTRSISDIFLGRDVSENPLPAGRTQELWLIDDQSVRLVSLSRAATTPSNIERDEKEKRRWEILIGKKPLTPSQNCMATFGAR